MSGGSDSTGTKADAAIIRAPRNIYKRNDNDPILWLRLAGSWPGYVFSGDPLKLPPLRAQVHYLYEQAAVS